MRLRGIASHCNAAVSADGIINGKGRAATLDMRSTERGLTQIKETAVVILPWRPAISPGEVRGNGEDIPGN